MLLISLGAAAPAPTLTGASAHQLPDLQAIVDDLRTRLALDAAIRVSIREANALLVSVDPPRGERTWFEMSFESAFLDQLDEEDLRAVVAHELGHVWIFRHHPYLQTERGANAVAMRIVSRESLERVYAKVWARGSAKGDFAHVFGN